jgi:hypothetical protein
MRTAQARKKAALLSEDGLSKDLKEELKRLDGIGRRLVMPLLLAATLVGPRVREVARVLGRVPATCQLLTERGTNPST